jgi:N-acetylmuramic acid 6-phosphate etherase
MTVTGVDYERAAAVLAESGGSVKLAIAMILTGTGPDEAQDLIDRAGGFVRRAVELYREERTEA